MQNFHEDSDEDIADLLDRDIDNFMERFPRRVACLQPEAVNVDNIADHDPKVTPDEVGENLHNLTSSTDSLDKKSRDEASYAEHQLDNSETENSMETLETNIKEFENSWLSSIETGEEADTEDEKEDSENEANGESNNLETEDSNDDSGEILELIQNRRPVKNEKILIFCKIRNSWQIVTLLTNTFSRYLSKGWFYNFKFQDGSTAGNYLHPGKPYWGLLTEE